MTLTLSVKSPCILLGSNISYFTGKMENYFKVRGIPYRLESMDFPGIVKSMAEKVGVHQMPAVILPDGRWMTDTTVMIDWFEREIKDNQLFSTNSAMQFIGLLLEDWADEWWWRPAMHYRWFYEEGARFASWHLTKEILNSVPGDDALKLQMLTTRQRTGYTSGDGVSEDNFEAVEASFRKLLKNLERILAVRPFLLGDRPGIADIGFSGPFFRHFALDPVPLEILRQEAPLVLHWVTRLWSTRLETCNGILLENIPEDIFPLLEDIGAGYLKYLNANVTAVREKKAVFDVTVDGITYKNARYSRYRVWCLSQIRDNFSNLPKDSQEEIKKILKTTGCWEPLWKEDNLPLDPNQEARLPFWADSKMVGVNEG